MPPPGNKPAPWSGNRACRAPTAESASLPRPDLRAIVRLGRVRRQAIWPSLSNCGFVLPRPRPAFGHGAEIRLASLYAPGCVLLIGCYHPSQQNTFTGRLTPPMLDAV